MSDFNDNKFTENTQKSLCRIYVNSYTFIATPEMWYTNNLVFSSILML